MQDQKISELIARSKTVAICISDPNDFDKVASALILTKFLFKEDNKATILFPMKPSDKIIEYLEEKGCSYQTSIDPVRYVIRIDYSKTPIEKVSYDTDEKNGKINFYITPKGKEFDFDNVEYDKIGVEYDLTIVIGAKRYEEMGDIFEENPSLFRKSKVVAISEEFTAPAVEVVTPLVNNTFSETVLDLIKDKLESWKGDDLTAKKEIYLITAEGLLSRKSIEDLVTNTEKLKLLVELNEHGVDLKELSKKMQKSLDKGNFAIQTELFKNIQIDEKNKIIWSGVSNHTIKSVGLETSEINLSKEIIFNRCEEYDIAVEVLEIEKGSLQITIESNKTDKYSALKIASVFEGVGTEEKAVCTVKNASVADFENIFYPVLSDLYRVSK